jgi:hypothetical protein
MQHLFHDEVAMPLGTRAEEYESIQPDSISKAWPV